MADILARQLREFSAGLWFWAGAGHRLGAVHAFSRFRIAARGVGARMELRPLGGAAHAVIAAYLVQSAAHHPRTHRMGSEGRAIHGGAACRSVATPAERRRARFFTPGG